MSGNGSKESAATVRRSRAAVADGVRADSGSDVRPSRKRSASPQRPITRSSVVLEREHDAAGPVERAGAVLGHRLPDLLRRRGPGDGRRDVLQRFERPQL